MYWKFYREIQLAGLTPEGKALHAHNKKGASTGPNSLDIRSLDVSYFCNSNP